MTTISNTSEQYVYVMSNISFDDDILKIGWTRKHPSIRANDLHTSGIPTPFIVEFVIITKEGSKLEKIIHKHIKQYRLKTNREFFKISKDNLKEILTNELNYELKTITEIIKPLHNPTKYKKVNEIKNLYEILQIEYDDFSSKLENNKTELLIKEINNKKHIYIRTVESVYNSNCLDFHGFEDDDERYIKNTFYFAKRDIKQYKKWIDNLLENYEEIKDDIGIEKMRSDNKDFKNFILDTHSKLNILKSKYVWEL